MISAAIIRDHVRQFLASELDLDGFEDWLVAESWNMHLQAPPEVQKLAAALELRLAEYSSGHLDEDGLSDELNLLLHFGCVERPMQVQMLMGPTAAVATVSGPVDVQRPLNFTLTGQGGDASHVTLTGSGKFSSTI